jgi:hypothetical protein
LGYDSAPRRSEAMVDSGTCDICGKPVEPAQGTDIDMETGNLVHAACLKQKEQAAREGEHSEPLADTER